MFKTQQMSICKVFSNLLTNPEITKTPNFIKALSLIQTANVQILPQVLRQIHDNVSLKTFETELKEYYSHLANIFIPNLLNILNMLRQQEPQKSFAALHQAIKFILEFPVDLFPQVEIFIHTLTRSCIKNINSAPIKEILEVVKLNNFIEIRNKKKFLLPDEKALILDIIIKNKAKLEATELEMRMHCRFTLFIDDKDKFSIFEPDFKTILAKKQSEFNKQNKKNNKAQNDC